VSKLLVVDKSIFHALYHCDDKLCAFVKNYNVVLPDALAVECLISEKQKGPDDKDPEKLLRSFQGAIKAGAKMGCSSSKLFQIEKDTLCPAKSVVDESTTKLFRNGIPNTNAGFIKQGAERCRKAFEPTINLLLKIAEKLYENLCKEPELAKELSKQQGDITDRYKIWIQVTDASMKSIFEKEFSEQISSRADASWFTWQITRLCFAYILDWMFKKNLPGSSEKKSISNDLYDIEYVAYLSRADGLLTNDKKQELLAKAAFPEKKVFVVDTRVNESRKVQDVFDDIVNLIPKSYKIGWYGRVRRKIIATLSSVLYSFAKTNKGVRSLFRLLWN